MGVQKYTHPNAVQRSRVLRFLPGVPLLAHMAQLGKTHRDNNNTTEAECWIIMHGSRTRAKKLHRVQEYSMHSGSPVQGQCRFDVCDVFYVGGTRRGIFSSRKLSQIKNGAGTRISVYRTLPERRWAKFKPCLSHCYSPLSSVAPCI